ncbi:acetylxylan esterase [Opitutaceae bacterium EW11]|nr:acetylxylan esterase [Opitutaceae bacterium EW11]
MPSGLPAAPASGPVLCQRDYLTPEQGREVLEQAKKHFADAATWNAYADHVRLRIQQGARLAPWPQRTPLNPTVLSRRIYDGYTVENVTLETVPGYFLAGNLYRPSHTSATFPVMLVTHGHTPRVEKPADYDTHGRFHPDKQRLCASLARLGVVTLVIDMFGYGDSILQVGQDAHRQPFSLTIQTWDSIRSIDFLLSLPGADPKRVGVTGESGGGTQDFLLAALDDRVTLSAPVVMVSAHFFGGCPCESGLPIHRSADHFANNALIAALAAPRSMLVVSDGKDWTSSVPVVEYPFLQHIYRLYGAVGNVANAHFPEEGHDYGRSKREAVYRFVAERFGLDASAVKDTSGAIDESPVSVESADSMHAFSRAHPLPSNALHGATAVENALRDLQQE